MEIFSAAPLASPASATRNPDLPRSAILRCDGDSLLAVAACQHRQGHRLRRSDDNKLWAADETRRIIRRGNDSAAVRKLTMREMTMRSEIRPRMK